MQKLTVSTGKTQEVIDITERISRRLKKSDNQTGVVHLFVLHTTAALAVADLDPGTDLDLLDAFRDMVPKLEYRHPNEAGHVSDHILASLIGPSLNLPAQNSKLLLGT